MASAYVLGLQQRRDYLAGLLADTTINTVGGKPDASTSDGGTTVQHTAARMSWLEELKRINELLVQESAIEAAIAGTDGGFEIMTQHFD